MNNQYILCFDTCLDKMYLILMKDEQILSSEIIENHDSKYHSAFLISTIKDVLKKNNIAPKDLSLIGINIGPGSFTGIRACTTTARVMAQQLNIKATGISSLEIITKAYQKIQKSTLPILTALDARKNMAYLYINNEIKGAVALDEVKSLIETGNYEVLTDNKLLPIIGGSSYQKISLPIGETLAELVKKKSTIDKCNWQELKPLYIQPPPMG